MENKNESKIKDIYDGKEVRVWRDDEFVTIAIGLVTIGITPEEWKDIKTDFKRLLNTK